MELMSPGLVLMSIACARCQPVPTSGEGKNLHSVKTLHATNAHRQRGQPVVLVTLEREEGEENEKS